METKPIMQFDARTAKVARYFDRVEGGRMGVPVSLQVALTDSCFNRCAGCGHPMREQRRMEVERWLGVLDYLRIRGVESVCYSGGDPMAYSDFNDVMRYHVDHQMPFGMTITGYVPNTIDIALLKEAEWVRVSLDAITPEVYEKARGKIKVDKVLASIHRMLDSFVNVQLGVTLSPVNESELELIEKFAADNGITHIDARYAYPQSNPMWPDKDLEQRGVMPFNNCHAALYQLYIDSDGSVFPCCITAGDTRTAAQSTSLGNVYQDAWDSIWENVVAYTKIPLRELPPVCRTCCVQRLSEINHICGKLVASKSFF